MFVSKNATNKKKTMNETNETNVQLEIGNKYLQYLSMKHSKERGCLQH
jgi:hypothetical protein